MVMPRRSAYARYLAGWIAPFAILAFPGITFSQVPEFRLTEEQRNRALAQADERLRSRLLELAKQFPQLKQTSRGPIEKLLAEPSSARTLFVAFQWPPATKAGPTMEVPAEQKYKVSAILRPPSSEPTAAELNSYPSWAGAAAPERERKLLEKYRELVFESASSSPASRMRRFATCDLPTAPLPESSAKISSRTSSALRW